MNQWKQAAGAALQRLGELLGKLPAKRVEMGLAVLVTLLAIMAYAFVATGTRGTIFLFLQNVELRSLDALFKSRGPRPVDERIVIVDIDDNTLRKVGAWPIPRSGYAKLIDQLHAGGAKVVSFDVSFPTPEKNSAMETLKQLEVELSDKVSAPVIERIREIEKTSDNDVILAAAIKNAGNVILGHSFLDPEAIKTIEAKAMEDYFNILWAHPFPQVVKAKEARQFDLNAAWREHGGQTALGVFPNLLILVEDARSVGFYDMTPDADGTLRNATLLVRYEEKDWYPSLPLETLRVFENIKDQSSVAYMVDTGLDRMEVGPHNITTRGDATALINFAGPFRSYRHYSMADVIDGTVPAATFRDKVVFVGATAKGIGDMRSTPYQKQDENYMGVEIHANVLDNLLHSDERGRGFIRRGVTEEMIDLAVIVLFGIGLGYWFGHAKPKHATVGVVVVVLVFGFFVRFMFSHFGMWLFVVMPIATLLVDYGAITSYRMIFEEREKRKVRRTFARYVSPGVIALIEKDPRKYFRAGGESKELTVMFSDIRSFTAMSEGMTPDELVGFLNEYLGEMTEILFRSWGTLDKYIGDAIMAFWGSPYPQDDHFNRACAGALDMSARLDELNLKWEAEGKKHFQIGIGINSGIVNVGNMGSDKRFAWTVMGDNVNLASRLEGMTKEYKVRTVISEFTYRKVKDHYVCRELDRIRVKGKLQPVGIYELLAFAKDAPRYADLLERFDDAMKSYKRMQFEETAGKLEALLQRYPEDGPSHVMLHRAHEFLKETPAPDWDGVYVMKTK